MKRARSLLRALLHLSFTLPSSALLAVAVAPVLAGADEIDYARLCTTMTAAHDGAHAFRSVTDRKGEEERTAYAATDPTIARAIADKLRLPVAPTVVVRHVEKLIGPYGNAAEVVLASDLDPSQPHWCKATIASDGSLGTVEPADAKTMKSLSFARGMAAYVLFNDLMGGDQPFPRDGCKAIFADWFAQFPAVLETLEAAMSTDPQQEPALAASVRSSWNGLRDAPVTRPEVAALTRQTLDRIGRDPKVTLVYRDPGLPGDGIGEIDVVRIGGATHTYAIVGSQHPTLSPTSPMCVVGDNRCGRFSVWP